MVFFAILSLLPLIGIGSAAAIKAISKGIPTEGSVFRIAGQGSQAWIILDGQRRSIDTNVLDGLGFDISTDSIKPVEESKLNGIPVGSPVTLELVHAMRL